MFREAPFFEYLALLARWPKKNKKVSKRQICPFSLLENRRVLSCNNDEGQSKMLRDAVSRFKVSYCWMQLSGQ